MSNARNVSYAVLLTGVAPPASLLVLIYILSLRDGTSIDYPFLCEFCAAGIFLGVLLSLLTVVPLFMVLAENRWLNLWSALIVGFVQGLVPLALWPRLGQGVDGRFEVTPVMFAIVEIPAMTGALIAWLCWRHPVAQENVQ